MVREYFSDTANGRSAGVSEVTYRGYGEEMEGLAWNEVLYSNSIA
jgi:hypothetical protein